MRNLLGIPPPANTSTRVRVFRKKTSLNIGTHVGIRLAEAFLANVRVVSCCREQIHLMQCKNI